MFIQVEPVRPSVLDVLVCCVDMVLNTEWVQIEAIDLTSDGSGWGFGITGGRSTGVVVKTVVPGSAADKDGRLQIGDHIIQIGDISLRGMGSEQVAMVLRQCGPQVHLIVARPVEPTSPEDSMMQRDAPIVPTRLLSEPEELEQHLNIFNQGSNGFPGQFLQDSNIFIGEPSFQTNVQNQPDLIPRQHKELISIKNSPEEVEMEKFEVNLIKDYKGLGIIVAGYVCEREDISGIFVKSIAKGSVADLCGQIRVHDQVMEVDGHPLKGYSNCEAVEILRNTGKHVKLQLARYQHGAKFEHLQEAMGAERNQILRPDNLQDCVPVKLQRESPKKNYAPDTATITRLKSKWKEVLGPKHEIIVADLQKGENEVGFGFNVESTEEENSLPVRHFISDICKGHSLDRNGTLFIGDELLEVNGKQLRDKKYSEVLSVFKSLPLEIVLTCARSYYGASTLSLVPWTERLLKAKSDSHIVSSIYRNDQWLRTNGRSLEHLSSIATWSSEPYFIDLVKDDNGLGFSITEYKKMEIFSLIS